MMKYLLAAAATLLLAASPQTARADDTKLTIMAFVGIQNLPLFAAQSQGFFAKHGLAAGPRRRQMADCAYRF